MIRLSKAFCVLAMALFASLVSFGNITDYETNFAFVQHVFSMDTIFPDSHIKYRAIESPIIHTIGYIGIIAMETLTAIFCWIGGFMLLKNVKSPVSQFNQSKKWAVIGLALGFLTWQVAFMSVGGEWFGMWMSKQWNGVPDAFRFFITMLIVLIFVVMPDREEDV